MTSFIRWVRNGQVNVRFPWPSLLGLVVSGMLLGMAIASLWALSTNIQNQASSPSADRPSPAPPNPRWDQPAWKIAVNQLPQTVSLPTTAAQRHPLAPRIYDQAMAVGYAAYKQKDYHTALINFRRALEDRVGDRYATEAIANTEAIIQYGH